MKIIFSDLDGTLLFKNESKLNKNIKSSVYSILNNGDLFAVSSGRTYIELKNIFKEFENDIYFIANDGALVVHEEQTLYHSPLDKNLFTNFKCFSAHAKYVTYIKSTNYMHKHNLVEQYRNNTMIIDSIDDINEPIYKISDYDKTIACPLPVVYQNPDMNEYIADGINKGKATEFILRHLKINIKDAIAFGDNINDIEMFKACGTSYAVSTALPQVKKHADKVIYRVEDELTKIANRRKRIWNFLTLKK